jgi:hypothetical protein
MFYLNRTGAPEGPFEESKIVAMIASGEVSHANICFVGHSQWAPLGSHPPFAQALAARNAPPPAAAQGQGYGAPAPAYAPLPAAGHGGHGYGAPQAAPAGYGPPHAPAAGYGAPQAAPAQGAPQTASGTYGAPAISQGRNRPASGGGGRMILILAIVGIVGLFLVGTAVGAYMLFFGGGAPEVAASVPRDTEVFVEIPSFKKSILDIKDVQFIETSARDDKKVIQDAVSAVSRAFELSETDAQNLMLAAESGGFGLRKVTGNTEAVVVLGFQRSGPVDTLIQSRRFSAGGAFASGGKKLFLAKKEVADKATSDMAFRALSELEVSGQRDILVWFAEQKLLVFGSEPMVSDTAKVIESGAPPLKDNPNFETARKNFSDDSRLVGFVDPSVLASVTDRSAREIIDGYFKPAGPMTASVRVKSAGFLMSVVGRFMGTKLPKSSTYEPAIKLTLSDRLPAETFAYAAFSTKSKMAGAEVEKLLLDQIATADPGSRTEIERGLRQAEELLGVKVQKLYDSLGEQAAVAVLGPGDFAFEQIQSPEGMARFALVYVQQLKDEGALKSVAQTLKSKVLPSVREANVRDDGTGGLVVTPRDAPLPVSLRAKFLDRHLFVALGNNALLDRAEAAFTRSERTLKDDAAHKSALAVLPEASHLVVWIDTGRTADTILKSPLVKAMIEAGGIQMSNFKLTGPERVTTALAARAEAENETWTYHVDALNMHAIAPLASGAALMSGGRALGAQPGLAPGLP